MLNKKRFSMWLEKGLSSMKNENAFCINLYEEDDDAVTCELVGSKELIKEDGEWFFEETSVFSRQNPFTVLTANDNKNQSFCKTLQIFADCLNEIVESNKNIQSYIKNKKLAFGFVDGDLYFLGESGQAIFEECMCG